MSDSKSVQGNRVAQELEALRKKQLAKNQRDKLKDFCSPLTTPEEAQAFLAAMREKNNQRDNSHIPPSNMSQDGIQSWHAQQRQREKEMRERRKEAEAILRSYRGSADPGGFGSGDRRMSLDTPKSYISDLFDPAKVNLTDEMDHAGAGLFRRSASERLHINTKLTDKEWSPSSRDREEKKSDDGELGWLKNNRKPPTPPLVQITSSQASSEFVHETVWREFISTEPGAKFPPEAGRYHMYVSYACPGSHRALIVRAMKGLEDVISVTYVHPTWRLTNPNDPDDKHRGWVFGNPYGEAFPNTIGRGGPFPPAYHNNDPDPEFNAYSIREIYERAQDTSGKYTIPLLWDKKHKTIVNNESSDIAYILNSSFNDFATNPSLDLYTEDDEDGKIKLNEVSEWLTPLMIHGVYKCGFAKNQRSYDRSIAELCDAFDRADELLMRQRYLTGDTLTDADIRLFVTLIRFDEVYAFYFKANARLVMLTPSLLNFCREIYQTPGVAATCDMDQIKAHFYASHVEWNKYSIVPRGLGFMELLEMPHNRDEIFFENEV